MVFRLTLSITVGVLLIAFTKAELSCNSPDISDFESCFALNKECVWCEFEGTNIDGEKSYAHCVSKSVSLELLWAKIGVRCQGNIIHKIGTKKVKSKKADDDDDDGTAPDDDEEPPSDDDSTSSDDEAPPSDDQAPPSDDQAPPSDDQAPPTDDQAPPTDDQVPPTDDQAPPTDDQAPPTDDQAPPTDDQAPPETDDNAPPPNDDVVPDNFWTCLEKKNSKDCATANCTWCDTKAGFGVCMTGAAADAASNSSWFTCKTEGDVVDVKSTFLRSSIRDASPALDPYDSSCIMVFLNDQTEAGCISATDENGQTCEWCSVAGMANVCLTADQAAMGAAVGISCDDSNPVNAKSPTDLTCSLAYLQDQSKESCQSTVDSDGEACKYCSVSDSLSICVNQEQAEIAGQIGITCDDDTATPAKIKEVNDPYDTSCILAFLQDQSKEGCLAATDADGNSCEFCSLQGSPVSLCLTAEQAEFSEQFGIDCSSDEKKIEATFPSDFFECLENYKDDDCRTADGCTWCNTEVGMGFCLSAVAAETTKKCSFFDCELGSHIGTIAEAQL